MDIIQLRKEIDTIDDSIFELLAQRMQIVKHVGELKRQSQTRIYRPEREREILARLHTKSEGENALSREAIDAIYMEIFAASRNLELPERVAYLGPLGSYTHQAAESRFGRICSYMSMKTISSVFRALEHGRAQYGIVPIENNKNGAVGETLDNLAQTSLKIIGEIVMPIHHSLASLCESPDQIRRIYSKDIAFGQCYEFLNQHNLEEVERVAVESTARAAQLAANEKDAAAICSRVAAKLYALPVLFESIEDFSNNQTRFVILGDFANEPSGNDKTSLCVDLVDSDKPGTLAGLLNVIKEAGVNMSKIESRPKQDSNTSFAFQFFIDLDGHIRDPQLQQLLATKHSIKWLGSYTRGI